MDPVWRDLSPTFVCQAYLTTHGCKSLSNLAKVKD